MIKKKNKAYNYGNWWRWRWWWWRWWKPPFLTIGDFRLKTRAMRQNKKKGKDVAQGCSGRVL